MTSVAFGEGPLLLATLPPSKRHLQLAIGVVIFLLVVFGALTPVANTHLAQATSFIAIVLTVMIINDLITSTLFFAQFFVAGRTGLLVLAITFLFSGLMMIPVMLIFPGAFAPAGLLGAGLQSAIYLQFLFRVGSPLGVIAYALVRDVHWTPGMIGRSRWGVLISSACAVAAIVCILTWFATAGDRFLPAIYIDPTHASRTPLLIMNAVLLSSNAIAIALLWARRRSVLDLALMVMSFTWFLFNTMSGVIITDRFTVGWYGARGFEVFASMVVFLVLLSETTTLYALENSRLYGQYRGAQRALERASMTERLRIARELHDTLLQSFHGVLLRFQTVVELLPGRPSDAKKLLLDAIDQAAQAITEGRDAVQGLRTSVSEMNDLADSIRALGEELVAEAPNNDVAKLRVDVRGASRDLHATVRDEAFRIAGEALRNAVQHAGAKQIEVEVRCDERQFELRVRDDGKGIDPELLSKGGREGHFGLRGMHERAKVIGGKLTVWSRPDAGTEVELNIPALHAYAESAPRSGLATKLFPQGSTTES